MPGARAAKRQDGAPLSYATNSEKSAKRAGRGALPKPTTFTRKAKRRVRNACGALEKLYNHQVVFLTLTFPGSTDEVTNAISSWSADIFDRLGHWIRYHAPDALFCLVWERHVSGRLHAHGAIGTRDTLALRRLERGFQEYVTGMFMRMSRKTHIDWFARQAGGTWLNTGVKLRCRIEPVRKSVKRYMAKYITKESGAGSACPSRWWGVSRNLDRAVKALTVRFSFQAADWIRLESYQGFVEDYLRRCGYKVVEWREKFSVVSRTVAASPPDFDHSLLMTYFLEVARQPR
jgi:hypothetical protein